MRTQAQIDIKESLDELLTWMKSTREQFESAQFSTPPALILRLTSWIEILEPVIDALPEVMGENQHLIGCANSVLRMAAFDIADPMHLIPLNIELGYACALAKSGLKEK